MINNTTLKMYTYSGPLFIDVGIWNKTKQTYNKGLLNFDTGATVTTISKDILHNLGYDVLEGKTQKISTASSIEYVREVSIDKIRLGDIELKNVMVYAHAFPEEGFSTGVIGLNILSKFDIELLFSKQLIKMTRIYN